MGNNGEKLIVSNNNFLARILRKKNLDEIILATKTSSLKRSLTLFDLIILGIGAVIGSGIFTLSGVAIAGQASAGPSFIISLMIAGFACILAAFSYAEFAAMIPVAGSAYTYTFSAFGELAAWVIGWVLMLEYAIGNITVAVGWSGYWFQLLQGFQGTLPDWMINKAYWIYSFKLFGTIPFYFNIPALLMICIVTALLYKGTQESTKSAAVMVLIKLVILAVFVFTGAHYVRPEHWVPFMPGGFSGIAQGAFLIFFAYIGFDAVSTAAEETKNPQRDVPLGIICSLVICTIIYIAVAAVLTGMLPGSQIIGNQEFISAPIAYVMRAVNQGWIAGLISMGAVAGLFSVLIVLQLGTTRILFAMSRDKLLPSVFAKVHSKFQTPHVVTLTAGLFILLGTLFLNLEEAAHLCNIGTFTAFIIVSLGVIVLRYTDPGRERPFRIPFMPVIPVLGIIVCLLIIALAIPLKTFVAFSIWIALGLVIYFNYGYKRTEGDYDLANPIKEITEQEVVSVPE
jgi:APA family basic amino acid/polyamine antiporter